MLGSEKQKTSNKILSRNNLFFIAVVFCFFLQGNFNGNCQAAMKSANYKIDADVIGAAGSMSTSANYHLGDTLGEPVIGEGASANYKTKAGFWYMLPVEAGGALSLACESTDVYMTDYTLGSSANSSTYLFSEDQECIVTDNSSFSWSLSMQSTNMTSPQNNIPNTNVNLTTNGVIDTPPTITSPTSNVKETNEVGGDYPLNISQDMISGDTSASGNYNVRPSVKLVQLNTLHNESTSGTLTFTVQ